MKRLVLFIAVGALLLGAAWPALAQQAPAFTVSFGGQFRVAGIAFNNLKDFTDTNGRFRAEGADLDCRADLNVTCKDSDSFMHERLRLFTTIESADKKARVVWGAEVGDIAFGSGGGASGAEYGGSTTRVGPSSGGGLGADGANVETKNAYLWVDLGGFVPGTSVLLGTHNIVFLGSPTGAFMDDDASGIQFNWKSDVADIQAWMAKTDENNRQDADDNTMYALRAGVNITKDLRFTVEGLTVDQQCFARRAAVPPATGSCVSADVFDTFWIGATVGAKLANISLDGSFVYGQRQLYSAALDTNVEEKGFGLQLTARLPLGPVSTWFHGWYTTGDDKRFAGTAAGTGFPASALLPGTDFTTASNTTRLNADSDKLPVPIAGASWLGAPFIGEALGHSRTIGNISFGQPFYNDWTGTWGVGASGIYALIPSFSVGAGAAYVRATETESIAGGKNAIFGDHVIEFDGGALYQFNPQTSFQLVGSYLVPDTGDNAWAVVWRAFYAF